MDARPLGDPTVKHKRDTHRHHGQGVSQSKGLAVWASKPLAVGFALELKTSGEDLRVAHGVIGKFALRQSDFMKT